MVRRRGFQLHLVKILFFVVSMLQIQAHAQPITLTHIGSDHLNTIKFTMKTSDQLRLGVEVTLFETVQQQLQMESADPGLVWLQLSAVSVKAAELSGTSLPRRRGLDLEWPGWTQAQRETTRHPGVHTLLKHSMGPPG